MRRIQPTVPAWLGEPTYTICNHYEIKCIQDISFISA